MSATFLLAVWALATAPFTAIGVYTAIQSIRFDRKLNRVIQQIREHPERRDELMREFFGDEEP